MATAFATKGTENVEKKTVSISAKRQITIPIKFYKELGFNNEAECEIVDGKLVIRPICRNIAYNTFSANILQELISEGCPIDKLVEKFTERQNGIRTAVVNMIEDAEKVANGEGEYFTFDEVFDSEDEE